MFGNFVVLYRMKELTKAEEQVMQILWNLQQGFVKDIIQKFPDPKPAVTTVSTIIRILEKKEFVSHKAYGNSYMYYPTVTKKEYTKTFMSNFVKNYFDFDASEPAFRSRRVLIPGMISSPKLNNCFVTSEFIFES